MLAGQFDQTWILVKKRWRCTFDPTFESGKRRKASGAPLFSSEDLDDINPSTDLVVFDTLLQDESLSEDVRENMRLKYEQHRRQLKSGEHARASE